MKCSKCGFENIVRASYCNKCGEKFKEEERKKAYKKTIFGKIETFENLKAIITLEKITGHIAFKIISLLIVLGIGLYFLFTMGIDTRLLESKNYEIFYNKNYNEYYLLVDDTISLVDVSLYRPNRVQQMTVNHYDINGNLLEEKVIEKNQNVSLTTFEDDYYIIKSKYSSNKEQSLKVLVYKSSDI